MAAIGYSPPANSGTGLNGFQGIGAGITSTLDGILNGVFGTDTKTDSSGFNPDPLANFNLQSGITAGFDARLTTNAPNGTPGNPGNRYSPYPYYGGNPNWPILRQGVLRNIPGSISNKYVGLDPDKAPAYELHFLYNPNEIDISMNVDSNGLPPIQLAMGQPLPSGTPPVPIGAAQQINFSLLFDRTYDMMYDPGTPDHPGPGNDRGVLFDIAVLYNAMGASLTQAMIPYAIPMEVMFGQTVTGKVFGVTGHITNFDIIYGIFRYDMIPARCEVDISMQVHYTVSSVPSSTTDWTSVSPVAGTSIMPSASAVSSGSSSGS